MSATPILFLIDELETWGGAERHLFELCLALRERHVIPTVAALHGTRQVPRFREAGLEVQELGVTRVYGPSGGCALARLVAHVTRSETRLLVTYHTTADLLGPLVSLATGVPTLSSRRDLGFTKKRSHLHAHRTLNRYVAGMVAVSDAVRQAVVEQEGYPRGRIHVIHNGVDAERYAPRPSSLRAELGISEDEILIGTLANFDPIKGYDVLVPAVLELCARTPARVLLVGDGPLRQEVTAQLAPLGDRVLIPGARRDVEQILWALDVFVLASHSEGFSNALLEAMAAERAVCATRVGGNPELIDDETGILVPPGSPGDLATALSRLCSDPALRRRYGRSARQRILREFTYAHMVDRYEEVFAVSMEETAGRPRRRAAKHAAAVAYRGTRPVIRAARSPDVVALCYHRVADVPGGWEPALTVSCDTFRRQLEVLAGSYELCTCGTLAQSLLRGERRRLCAVSFDDGYRDNLTHALPILRELGVPWTLFVATEPMDEGGALWFERVAALLYEHLPDLPRLASTRPRLAEVAGVTADAGSRREAVRAAIAILKGLATGEREELEASLVEAWGPPAPDRLPPFLDWDGVRSLTAAGVELGAHTTSHPILPRTDEEQAAAEISNGRARLEAETGTSIAGFAYPNGDHDAVSVELVRSSGFAWAFTASPAPWDGDPLRIPRRVVAEQASRGFAGPFSEAAFLAEVEGLYDALRASSGVSGQARSVA